MAATRKDPRHLPLCPLAKRIPQPKAKASSLTQHTNATMEHSAFVNSVNLLFYFPEERVAVEKFILASLDEKECERRLGEGSFECVSTVGTLDDAWVISWISGKNHLKPELLKQALMFDRRAINNIFCYMLGVLPHIKLPEECCMKQFLCWVCDYLWERRGGQLDDKDARLATLVKDDGQVDMTLLVYELEFNVAENRVSTVAHRKTGTKVTVDTGLKITRDFYLERQPRHSQQRQAVPLLVAPVLRG